MAPDGPVMPAPTEPRCTFARPMPAPREKTTVPGVYKRGSRYEVTYRHRGQWRSKAGFRTLAEARAFKARANAGLERQQSRERFEDYAASWLDGYRGRTSRGIKAGTLKSYRASMDRYAIPFFRGYKLAEIERPDIREFVTSLETAGLAPAAIRRVMAPLKAMFATAVEDGLLQVNPTTSVRIMGRPAKVEEVRERALTRHELAAFLAAADPDWRLFFEFLAQTGVRISEAIGLTVGDLVFGQPTKVKVRRQFVRGQWDTLKSNTSRRDVPLSPAMSRALWTRCAGQPSDAPLFPSPQGRHLREENVRKRILAPARQAAGLTWPGFGFHTFRHTCASMLFESGKNVAQVARWLGHEDPSFTLKTYIHLMDAGVGDADFFDSELGGNRMSTGQPETTRTGEPPPAAEVA